MEGFGGYHWLIILCRMGGAPCCHTASGTELNAISSLRRFRLI